MKKTEGDLYCAWVALFGAYEDIDDIICKSPYLNPEQALIKKDSYEKLTSEAKEVISTIIDAPAEFIAFCIAPKTGEYRRKKDDKTHFIKSYFRKKWNSRLKVSKTFTEIERYVKKIN